jgi:phosphoglucosamine mutase
MRADLGVMISASHNPYHDNGVKFFGPDGFKLSDEIEADIERLMAADLAERRAASRLLGRAKRIDDAGGRYIEAVKAGLPHGLTLEGLTVAIDCANGAAYKVAPQVLTELGAKVIALGVAPDGFNINHECGSTHPETLAETVGERGADVGIALDGDADRLVLVSERGEIIDGDQIMATIADSWADRGHLKGGGVVATQMSNLGLERHLRARGLRLERTAVGDRYVLERMREAGYNLGGEQSGHLIMTDIATTGDGLLAALQVLATVKQAGRPVSAVCSRFVRVPQLLRNVQLPVGTNAALLIEKPHVREALGRAESRLSGGRLLVRKSGTEPLIRVMAEGDDAGLIESVVAELCAVIGQAAPAAAVQVP